MTGDAVPGFARHRQEFGWENLTGSTVQMITSEMDIISAGRLSRGIVGYRTAIREDVKHPFGTPVLLHMEQSSCSREEVVSS